MEKETTEVVGKGVKVALDSGFLGWIGALATGAFAWLLNKYHRSIGHRISNVHQTAASAAALAKETDDKRREDITAVYENLNSHLRRDEEIHTKLLEAMGQQTSKLSDIHVALVRELADRPTRSEVREMLQQRAA